MFYAPTKSLAIIATLLLLFTATGCGQASPLGRGVTVIGTGSDAGDASDAPDTPDVPPDTSAARFAGTRCANKSVNADPYYNIYCRGNVGCWVSSGPSTSDCSCDLCADQYCLQVSCY